MARHCGSARVGTKRSAWPYIGWPAIVGLKFLDVLIAERWAKPSFPNEIRFDFRALNRKPDT
jgi:hypothetical protein